MMLNFLFGNFSFIFPVSPINFYYFFMKKKMILVGALLVVNTQVSAQQEEREIRIDTVTIAGKMPQQLYETGKNVKLISAKDLEKYKGQTLNEVLNQAAGFQIVGNFNNASEPKSMKIRGGKSANILILIDGIPMKDVTGNDYTVSDLRLLALENVESVEILNGSSSVLYGSNATVSVINIKTRKASQKKIEGILGARAGSFSTFAQNALIKGKLNHFNYQLSGFNEKSDGLSAAEGTDFEKDGFEKQNLLANFGFSKGKFDVNVSSGWNHHFFHFDSGAFADGTDRSNDQQFQVGGNIGYTYTNGKLTVNARHSTNERIIQSLGNAGYADQYKFEGDNFFTEILNSYKISPFLDITAGFQYEKQSMAYSEKPWGQNSLQEVLKFADTNVATYDVFAKAHFSYKNLHLDAGTRMTNHSKFGSHWVYSINPYFLKEIETLYFKAGVSYATAFVAPTLYQNFGAMPYIFPNFELKPETNQSFEADINFGTKDRTFNFYATYFNRKEKDVMVYEVVDMVTYQGKFVNLLSNKAQGFEIGADYKLNEMVKFGGNFSFVENEASGVLLRQPKQRINSYLELLPFRTTRINLSHQFTGKRADAYFDMNSFATEYTENPSFHHFNLNVNQKVNDKAEVFLNIGNLFNKSYIDIVGFTTKPRNYTFGVNYRF